MIHDNISCVGWELAAPVLMMTMAEVETQEMFEPLQTRTAMWSGCACYICHVEAHLINMRSTLDDRDTSYRAHVALRYCDIDLIHVWLRASAT